MSVVTDKQTFSLNNPFPAKLVENRLLNCEGSEKETRHLVVDISGSGMTYNCGDSLGVFPKNRPSDVKAMLNALGANGEELVLLPRQQDPIRLYDALESRLYFLAGPTRRFVEAVLEKATAANERQHLEQILSEGDGLDQYLYERHYIDILEEHPSARFTPQEIVPHLKRLVPRLYSIASSPTRYPEEIHLTVAVVRYRTLNRDRVGVGSTHLVDRVTLGTPELPVFVASSHFNLPEDDSQDIIMVGPGTGVAPFRSFLQEREARGATGRNWLFFGEQRRACDYLYEDEFEGWRKNGLLSRLDLAFSRDQEHKVYVQHRIQENKDEFWEWFSNGATLYICGDKARMARDVEDTLVKIAIEKGAVEDDDAAIKAWIRDLKKQKRYQLDVY